MWLGKAKKRALAAGKVDLVRRALHVDAWPDDVLRINNNINNQFQVPVLFYMVSVILWAVQSVSLPVLIISWGFVLSRIFHSYSHTGENDVPTRRKIFLVSSILLLGLVFMAIWAVIFSNDPQIANF